MYRIGFNISFGLPLSSLFSNVCYSYGVSIRSGELSFNF